jgi:hypothetical protein
MYVHNIPLANVDILSLYEAGNSGWNLILASPYIGTFSMKIESMKDSNFCLSLLN